MPSFTDEMSIDAPRTVVFDLFADARNELEWNDRVSRAELLTDEPIGEGSRFVVVDKNGEHEVTIRTHERPERLVFALVGKQMDVDISYRFTEAEGATSAAGTFVARPKGFMKVVLPLLLPLIKRDIAKQHLTFKELCERQTG